MRIVVIVALLLAACGQAPSSQAPSSQTPASQAPAPRADAQQTQPDAVRLQAADFAAYPATPYTGPLHLPDFIGAQRQFRAYRTALGDGARQGPNFAGRYALVQIGCGAGCNETYQVDVSSGAVAQIHFADETAVEIENRVASALLKARWFISPADPDGQFRCHFENYVWRGGELVSLGQAVTDGPCPDE